jgi:periplasmic divalent cation tolerance protein
MQKSSPTFFSSHKQKLGFPSVLYSKLDKSDPGELEKKILKIHPYEAPEIVALPLVKGYGKYLDWVSMETKGRRNK